MSNGLGPGWEPVNESTATSWMEVLWEMSELNNSLSDNFTTIVLDAVDELNGREGLNASAVEQLNRTIPDVNINNPLVDNGLLNATGSVLEDSSIADPVAQLDEITPDTGGGGGLPINTSSVLDQIDEIEEGVSDLISQTGDILSDSLPNTTSLQQQVEETNNLLGEQGQESLSNLAEICQNYSLWNNNRPPAGWAENYPPEWAENFPPEWASADFPPDWNYSLLPPPNLITSLGDNFSLASLSPNPQFAEQLWDLKQRIDNSPCPAGQICEGFFNLSCETLRNTFIDFGLGDLHAGAYCPGNETSRASVQYENCERGYYCPNSTTRIICPAGYYCPYKTANPEIVCNNCEEGSQELVRNQAEFAVAVFVPIIVLLGILFCVRRENKRKERQRAQELKDKQKSIDSAKLENEQKEYQAKLQRMLPRLQAIQERLRNHVANREEQQTQQQEEKEGGIGETGESKGPTPKLERNGTQSTRFGLTITTKAATEHAINFDPNKIFDAIDDDKSGDLTYEELNSILDLDALQLHEFLRRMNFYAGLADSEQSVTKPVFHKYFLRVLEETSHFAPTEEEVAALFDKIVLQHGYEVDGEILLTNLYNSPVAEFLSDSQIHMMIKGFESVTNKRSSVKRSSLTSRVRRASVTSPSRRRLSIATGTTKRASTINKAEFMEHYPRILPAITVKKTTKGGVEASVYSDLQPFTLNENASTSMGDEENYHSPQVSKEEKEGDGLDMTFGDLCLAVGVGNKSFNVVDHVTGRLCSGTMTALMGGSGAGKTSLLNALCGRAYYGNVTGKIEINGNISSIDEHKSSVGFVPQDDIVYAELTVRENLIFAGQFSLPKETSRDEIIDLVDATMAGLGLTRKADTIVGDVNRRGVSGGEKKRVNIGLELMSKPKILFLDEPTSGLDSSSALLVMSSLRKLVEKDGTTIVSVIHQPRKIIFELFDKVILLGEGGKVVYHGFVSNIETYFTSLHYELPPGEALADWLIDISSGRIAPTVTKVVGTGGASQQLDTLGHGNQAGEVGVDGLSGQQLAKARDQANARKAILCKKWISYFDELSDAGKEQYLAPVPAYAFPEQSSKPPFIRQLWINLRRHLVVLQRNWLSKFVDTAVIVLAVIVISALSGNVQPTVDDDMNMRFDDLISNTTFPLAEITAFSRQSFILHLGYANQVGVIIAVLTSLSATKIITEKKLEFFRESSSGYSINAYFLSVNIIATLRHTIEAIIAAVFALWIHNTATTGVYYFIHFIMLAWITVSWALLFPIIVPAQNVTLVVGFYMTFLSLLFAGTVRPVLYSNIYSNTFLEIFCGLLSPTRFFVEAMAVSEARCLPQQTGFTELGPEAPRIFYIFEQVQVAQNDFSTAIQQSCRGWYWGVLPSFFVGLTIRVIAAGAIHACDRGKQGKKALLQDMRAELRSGKYHLLCGLIGHFILVVGLLAVSIYFILRENP